MSFVDTPLFQELKPWLVAPPYDRDGGHKNPRRRVDLKDSTPRALKNKALKHRSPCPRCKRPIQRFRHRFDTKKKKWTDHIYLAATCPSTPPPPVVAEWKELLDSTAPYGKVFDALHAAAHDYTYCNKGNAATAEYKAVALAVNA